MHQITMIYYTYLIMYLIKKEVYLIGSFGEYCSSVERNEGKINKHDILVITVLKMISFM